jgi:hypothetical protein
MNTMKRSRCRTRIFLFVYFGIFASPHIFSNYFDVEIQLWNTSHSMSENQEVNPFSWFFVFNFFLKKTWYKDLIVLYFLNI